MVKKSRMGNYKLIFEQNSSVSNISWCSTSHTGKDIVQLYLSEFNVLFWSVFPGDLMDTVKIAAEGVKSHSSNVATWVRNNVSPTLRIILPASPGPPPVEPQPGASTSAAAWTETAVWDPFLVPILYYVDYIAFAYMLCH